MILLLLQGLFDAAYFNAVFGNVYDQRDELLRTALLLKAGQHALYALAQVSLLSCVDLLPGTLGCCTEPGSQSTSRM